MLKYMKHGSQDGAINHHTHQNSALEKWYDNFVNVQFYMGLYIPICFTIFLHLQWFRIFPTFLHSFRNVIYLHTIVYTFYILLQFVMFLYIFNMFSYFSIYFTSFTYLLYFCILYIIIHTYSQFSIFGICIFGRGDYNNAQPAKSYFGFV